jgi:predicted metalloendopeptidase
MRSRAGHRLVAGFGCVFVFGAALQSAPAAAPDKFEKGKVIEKVVCRNFADQSYAQQWRRNMRPEYLRLLVRTDIHAPAQYRVNGPLSNMAEFARAFDCPMARQGREAHSLVDEFRGGERFKKL